MANKTADKSTVAQSDYLNNMFQEGDNRTARKAEIKSGPGYDRAVHASEDKSPDAKIALPASAPLDTFHSRDGTDAAGLYDESGGPLGGTEKELDNLEAGGTPVDRTPHMKD